MAAEREREREHEVQETQRPANTHLDCVSERKTLVARIGCARDVPASGVQIKRHKRHTVIMSVISMLE